jgi:hypothetical protein
MPFYKVINSPIVNNSAITNFYSVPNSFNVSQVESILSDYTSEYSIDAHDITRERSSLFIPFFPASSNLFEIIAGVKSTYTKRLRDLMYAYESENKYPSTLIANLLSDKVFAVECLMNNAIPEKMRNLLEYSERSPKFSKLMSIYFNEKSDVMKLYNDRSKFITVDSLLNSHEFTVNSEYKVIVSLLPQNILTMSTNNDFSSCQDLSKSMCDNLASVFSSTKCNMIGVAYLVKVDVSYNQIVSNPHMYARTLLYPAKINNVDFLLCTRMYGDLDNSQVNGDNLLHDSLINVYGNHVLFLNEIENTYSQENTYTNIHNFDYDIRCSFTEGEHETTCECCECEGNGQVLVETVYSGHRFRVECPICEGTGEVENEEELNSWSEFPYIDNNAKIQYKSNWESNNFTSLKLSLDKQYIDKVLELING